MSPEMGRGDWRKPGTGGMFVIAWGRVQVLTQALGGLLACVSFPPRVALDEIQRWASGFLNPLTFPSPSTYDYNYTMSVSSGEDTAPANSNPGTPEMRLTVPNQARKTKRRIAVLTSGGDSAGMNAAGKSQLSTTSNVLLGPPAARCAGDRARVAPGPLFPCALC